MLMVLKLTWCIQVQIKEAVIEEGDVAKGISDFINKYHIHSIVIGASTRNALARSLSSFCLVYVQMCFLVHE